MSVPVWVCTLPEQIAVFLVTQSRNAANMRSRKLRPSSKKHRAFLDVRTGPFDTGIIREEPVRVIGQVGSRSN